MLTIDSPEVMEFREAAKANPELRNAAIREIVKRDDWRLVLDGLTPQTVHHIASEVIGLNNLSLDQITYVWKRYFEYAIGGPRQYSRNPKSEVAPKVFVVYWIVRDGEESFPLYVGQTKDLRKRWSSHRINSSELAGIDSRETLRIRIVETICGTLSEAFDAEKRHIIAARKINPNLKNGTFKHE